MSTRTTKERVTTIPTSHQWAPCRIGLWGTFDVESFGDLLLARILRQELRRRIPTSEVTAFAPYGHGHPTRLDGGDSAEPLGSWSAARVAELADRLDCVIVAGDDVLLRRDTSMAEAYAVSQEDIASRAPSRFFVEGLGELEHRCPVLWGGLSLSADPGDDGAVALRKAAASRPYIAVWDAASKRRLEDVGVDAEILIVPSPLWLAPRLFAREVLAKRVEYLKVMGWYPRDRPALVVQGDRSFVPRAAELATTLERLAADHGSVAVVIVQTDPWRGDGAFADALSGALGDGTYRLPVAGLEDLLAVLSDASGVVASSAAALITASAQGRPYARLDDPRGVACAFSAHVEAGPRPSVTVRLQAEVDACLDAMAAIAKETSAVREPSAGDAVDELLATVSALRHANRAQARRLVDDRLVFTDRLNELESALGGAEELLAAHGEVKAAQDGVIAGQRRALEELVESVSIQTAELDRSRALLEEAAEYASGLEARVADAEGRGDAANAELAALRATRTFRWAARAKALTARLRRPVR